MSSSRKNWAEQYQIEQDKLREKFLKKKLHKLIEESKKVGNIREKIVKLEEIKDVFLDLSRESIEYDKKEEEKVDDEIKELWKELEEQFKQPGTDYDSWRQYQEEEEWFNRQNDDDLEL